MELDGTWSVLRPWRRSDRDDLVSAADDWQVARNMTNTFPYPYQRKHAEAWIESCLAEQGPPTNLAIEVDGRAAGGIGINLQAGVRLHVGHVGYWLESTLWNRGIATTALRAFVTYAFATFPIDRLQATVFGWNPASGRVLEKCGFELEGRLRESIRKRGDVTDELIYGLLRSDWEAAGG